MGAGASTTVTADGLPEAVDRATAQEYAGSKWDGGAFEAVANGGKHIPRDALLQAAKEQVAQMKADIVAKDEGARTYVQDTFSSADACKKRILVDFFTHGFDGSGSDGGSCIDGRLTSAWNWTANVEKKEYYPIFLLAGFSGFDGDFRS